MSAEYVKKKIGLLAGQIFFFAYSIRMQTNSEKECNDFEMFVCIARIAEHERYSFMWETLS